MLVLDQPAHVCRLVQAGRVCTFLEAGFRSMQLIVSPILCVLSVKKNHRKVRCHILFMYSQIVKAFMVICLNIGTEWHEGSSTKETKVTDEIPLIDDSGKDEPCLQVSFKTFVFQQNGHVQIEAGRGLKVSK